MLAIRGPTPWDERLLRALAGPGTGKTVALLRRVARLLEAGIAPGSGFPGPHLRPDRGHRPGGGPPEARRGPLPRRLGPDLHS
jgi:hypothetical protein